MGPSLMSFPGHVFADCDALQRQIDRLLGSRHLNASIRAVERGAFPAVNIGTTAESVEIFAFAPGIDTSSLDVTVDKGLLTIAGERRKDTAEAGAKLTVYASERPEGRFRRVVSLPEDADPAQVQANYRDGVLHISVARRDAPVPTRIAIQ